MFKKLKFKFTLVTSLLALILVAIMLGTINIVNYSDTINKVDNIIEVIEDNNGIFIFDIKDDQFNKETEYQIRYFTSYYYNDELVRYDMAKIAALRLEDVKAYSSSIMESGKDKGFISSYRFHVKEIEEDYYMITVLDIHDELDTIKSFANLSLEIGLIIFALVIIIAYLASSIVLKPVIEADNKEKQFLVDANHELKTPLTIINANTEVIELESGENEWTKSTKNQVSRLKSMIDKMNMLFRFDEEKTTLNKEEFNFSSTVYEIADSFKSLQESSNKTLTLEVEENIMYHGDQKSLGEVVSILLDNAFKYSKSCINLTLKKDNQKTVLTVNNDVDNIPKGNLDKVFDRFYRLEQSRNSSLGGSGIGLAIAKEVINLHKGKISAYSVDGKSFEIKIIL